MKTCTCLGTCRGAEGLGDGWVCALKLHECKRCYEEFEERTDKPSLMVCMKCCPTLDDLPEWQCPTCGWDSDNCVQDETAPCKYSNFTPDWEYGWCGGQHWTETWTCPDCGTEFTYRNSSV